MAPHSFRQALATCLLVATACWAWAGDVVLNSVSVNVELQRNGSARITEVWDVQVGSDQVSELFNTYDTRYFGKIRDIAVSEDGNAFTVDGYWNPDATAADKAQHCGLVVDAGIYQLCWGIGQKGHHRYTVRCTATMVVRPRNAEQVVLNLPLFVSSASLPTQMASATISHADGHLASDDIMELKVRGCARGGLENGCIRLHSTRAMGHRDYIGLELTMAATAFDTLEAADFNTDITPEEMTSAMMRDQRPDAYQETMVDKMIDLYNQSPALFLLAVLATLIVLFYLIKKIAIALL
ncbi:MAG: hypothetical protein IJ160_03090 [Muribaculaceae bacterium]|nr:hypothetical protein [Muribaculaceae bacterium]